MSHLILIRHSVPEIVPTLPARHWHLSEVGRARCKLLADQIRDYSPEVVVSSLEPKAQETAQIVAHQLGLAFSTAEGLHEHQRDKYPLSLPNRRTATPHNSQLPYSRG